MLVLRKSQARLHLKHINQLPLALPSSPGKDHQENWQEKLSLRENRKPCPGIALLPNPLDMQVGIKGRGEQSLGFIKRKFCSVFEALPKPGSQNQDFPERHAESVVTNPPLQSLIIYEDCPRPAERRKAWLQGNNQPKGRVLLLI